MHGVAIARDWRCRVAARIASQSWMPPNTMKPIAIRPGDDEGDAEAREPRRHVASSACFSRIAASADDRERPAEARAERRTRRSRRSVVALDHEQRAAEDRAVDGDQRQEDAERRVERRGEAVERHLDDLHGGGDGADEAGEAEEAEVDVRQRRADPGQRALARAGGGGQVVERHGHAPARRRRRCPGPSPSRPSWRRRGTSTCPGRRPGPCSR